MRYKVSVIVTVHNAEQTLQRCMDSLMAQKFPEMEILCIDGGSTDASPDILREYAKQDQRIRILNDPNCSYGHKINRGIAEAQGEYIAILESDDRMKENMVETLYGYAEKYQADYVDADYEAVCRVETAYVKIPIQKYGSGECYEKVISYEERGKLLLCATGAIWTGLYRTAFLKEHQIWMYESPGASFQDTSFRFLVAMYARKSYHSHVLVYEYTMDNPESSIRDPGKIYAIPREYEFLYHELTKRQAGDEEWKAYWKWKYEGYYWNAARLTGQARDEFLAYYKKELTKDIQRGKFCQEQADGMLYQTTFFFLEKESDFLSCIQEKYERGNLNVNVIANFLKRAADRRIVVFGSGVRGQTFMKQFKNSNIQIAGICDNDPDKNGSALTGIPICSPAETLEQIQGALYVIPEGKYADAMESQLRELGVKTDDIFRFSA